MYWLVMQSTILMSKDHQQKIFFQELPLQNLKINDKIVHNISLHRPHIYLFFNDSRSRERDFSLSTNNEPNLLKLIGKKQI